MSNWTFENDDRKNEKLSDAMLNYVKHFPEFKKDGKGLLLYGTVGTGKTFYASCIANALIGQGYDALFRTFKQIERELWGAKDKAEYMKSLNRYHLLIFDDLGAERDSKYMSDIVFDIVDTRYKSGLPFIVTTNLSAEEIKKPQDIAYSRIYDRILERCHPIEVTGTSRRRQNVKDTYLDMNKKLGL
jgi:DNA replication protein DnaC